MQKAVQRSRIGKMQAEKINAMIGVELRPYG